MAFSNKPTMKGLELRNYLRGMIGGAASALRVEMGLGVRMRTQITTNAYGGTLIIDIAQLFKF